MARRSYIYMTSRTGARVFSSLNKIANLQEFPDINASEDNFVDKWFWDYQREENDGILYEDFKGKDFVLPYKGATITRITVE